MATGNFVGFALVLVSSAALALRRTGHRGELVALGISALAGLELGVGCGMPHGEAGLRGIAGGAIVATILSFGSALSIGLIQVMGIPAEREAARRSGLAPLAMIAAMPGMLFCASMFGVAVRGRLLRW